MKSTSLFVLAAISLVYAQAPPDKSVNVSGTKATLTTSKPGVSTNNKSAAPYTCPKGQFLTYGIVTEAIGGATLKQAQDTLGDWIASAPGRLVNSNGDGHKVGATRTWKTADQALGLKANNFDTLTNVYLPDSSSSSLEQRWSSGLQDYAKGLRFYQGWHDLTVQGPADGSVRLQFNNQTLAYDALALILQDAVEIWVDDVKQAPSVHDGGSMTTAAFNTVTPPSVTTGTAVASGPVTTQLSSGPVDDHSSGPVNYQQHPSGPVEGSNSSGPVKGHSSGPVKVHPSSGPVNYRTLA